MSAEKADVQRKMHRHHKGIRTLCPGRKNGCDNPLKENDHAMDEIRHLVNTITDDSADSFFVVSLKGRSLNPPQNLKRGESVKIPKFFQKQTEAPSGAAVNTPRIVSDGMSAFSAKFLPREREFGLYEALRNAVPVIDAAINKTVRLTGGFRVISSDESIQDELDEFVSNVKSGPSSQSLSSFIDCYLDSLLTYGSAAGEIIVDTESMEIAGVYNVSLKHIEAKRGATPIETEFYRRSGNNALALVKNPQLILFQRLILSPKRSTELQFSRDFPI